MQAKRPFELGAGDGTTIVLYDGQPDPHKLWSFAQEAKVTSFGTSAVTIPMEFSTNACRMNSSSDCVATK